MTLGEFMDELVWHRRYTTYPVTEDGRAVGLLPFRCVAEVPRREWDTRRVHDCMLPREAVPVVDPDDELIDAAAELSENDVNRALVLSGGRAGRTPVCDRRQPRVRDAPAAGCAGMTHLRVADGTRTRDSRDHNPGLYQLSYGHRATGTVAEPSGGPGPAEAGGTVILERL